MNAIVSYSVPDIERMARALSMSKLFGVTNPEQALALCLIAQSEGRHPASAAQDYNIIQGRPSKKADSMLRDFLTGGGKVEWHTLTDAKADATFSHPAGGSARIEWDMARAKAAGLGAKDMWKKFPRQMLRSRVVSEGVRTIYPMATSGMYVPEEVQDFGPEPTRAAMVDVTPSPALDAPSDAPKRYNANQCKTVEVTLHDGEVITKGKLAARLGNEIVDIHEVTEALAWKARWASEVSTWPLPWEDALWERLDIHIDELRAMAAKASEDSFRSDDPEGMAGDDDTFPGDRTA